MKEIKESERPSILNQAITIMADEPQDEGAPTRYRIQLRLPVNAPSDSFELELQFQSGAVGANGSNVNGISDESLIEVLINRFKAFQAGPWACEGNAAALEHLEKALAALELRTARRREADVEGTTTLMAGEKGYVD
ncbi:MAG: hypothetical protein KJP23_01530 [Deltaproteobacteria bacterium]|nr:hypothetical protein [Deltaproteobacteria bacterium]